MAANPQPHTVARLPRMDLRAAHSARGKKEGSVDPKRDRCHQLYATPEKSAARPRAPHAPAPAAPEPAEAPRPPSPGPGSPAPAGVTRLVSGALGRGARQLPASGPAAPPPAAHWEDAALDATKAEPVFKRLAVRQWALLDVAAQEAEEAEVAARAESPTPRRQGRAVPCFRRMLSPCRVVDAAQAAGPDRSAAGDDDTSQDPGISSGPSSDAGASPRSPHVRFGGVHTCPKSSTEQALEIETKLDHLLNCKTLRPEERARLLREVEALEAAYAAGVEGEARAVAGAAAAARPAGARPDAPRRDLATIVARLSKPKKLPAPEPLPIPKPNPNQSYKAVRSRVFDPPKQPQQQQDPRVASKGEARRRSRSAVSSAPVCVTESLEYKRWAAQNGFTDLHGYALQEPSDPWHAPAPAPPLGMAWSGGSLATAAPAPPSPSAAYYDPRLLSQPHHPPQYALAERDPPCRPRSEWL